jgi:hypothetical protein
MNERIKELAEQAIEDMPGAWNIPDEFCKKFAELIVRECQLRVDQYINECGEVASMPNTVIMKHFGVEE